ncbi:MAG TPA: YbaN family protein [Steroidobacteraceae bacterium]|nr:YbaN family protein [Steroidobacteraceae bacterium]
MLRQTQNFLWRAVALLAFAVGIVGLAIPVLPTVPFLILAAWAASKGWPAFELWLLEHRLYGPHIRSWRERRIVPRAAKIWAVLTMSASATLIQLLDVPRWLQIGTPLVMAVIAVWLCSRPES